jgi:hypothetical protein
VFNKKTGLQPSQKCPLKNIINISQAHNFNNIATFFYVEQNLILLFLYFSEKMQRKYPTDKL